MHLKSTRELCQDVGPDKKRYDYQTIFSPFSTGNIYRGIKAKCLGCKICYMHHLPGGQGREPQEFDKVFPKLRRGVNKGKTELITDLIEPFLNVEVGALILKVGEALPQARFNLITKLPDKAREVLTEYPEIQTLPYHLQVTTMMDGVPIPDIVDKVERLLEVAKSVSCRVDPFVPGISDLFVFLEQIDELSKVGIKRITTNTMKLYRGQWKHLPGLNQSWYSDGDKAGSAKIINSELESRYFEAISERCGYVGMGLGVCMSRPEVRVFETAPCEGIGLDEYEPTTIEEVES